jgi:hypothetical protein
VIHKLNHWIVEPVSELCVSHYQMSIVTENLLTLVLLSRTLHSFYVFGESKQIL